MPDGNQYDYESSPMKGILNAVKSFSKINQEKTKLMENIMTEQLKQKSSFMWKGLEKEQLDPIQRMFMERVQSQTRPGGAELEAEVTPGAMISPEARTRYEPTAAGGIATKTAPIAEALYQRITQKEQAGQPLSEGERTLKTRIEAKMGLGPKVEEEKRPTFAQEQKISAIKSGLGRGEAVIGEEFGEPQIFPIKSLADALKAIEMSNLDPSLFEEELKFYRDIAQTGTDKATGRTAAKMKDGRTIWLDTREEIVE